MYCSAMARALTQIKSIPVVLILTSQIAFGLKCYQCRLEDGIGDSGCGENPPPDNYLVECAQPQCWMKYSSNGTLHVERFCVAVATNINGCIASMVQDIKGRQHTGIECKCSGEDGCNGYSPNIINIQTGSDGSNGNGNGNYNNKEQQHRHNHNSRRN